VDVTPTGEFQSDQNMDLDADKMRSSIQAAIDGGTLYDVHASKLATELMGDSIGTNVLMLGYAVQKGLLPLSVASLQEAIRLNGTLVETNLRTFALGRLAAQTPQALDAQLKTDDEDMALATVDDVLVSRTRLLTAYQDAHYARHYGEFVNDIRRRVGSAQLTGTDVFVREVALTLARLMAYKDEYEIARLYLQPQFMQRLRTQFSGKLKLTFHLAPPLLPGSDPDGRPKKRAFGHWMLVAFRLLAPLKRVRGTVFDPFAYARERRMERRLIADYRALISRISRELNAENLSVGIELAAAAARIAGFGPVKSAAVKAYESRLTTLLRAFEAVSTRSRAA
jgi:indolepyruvate ferredoxin oxidoreductase